ncbi:peptidoglycan-binding protein [Micromonospora sp. CPCC 206060]|uniref:peptidoglycan-binding domain-containing protein n=1 Tax=Micromonospora sp. CPCC 206060 TaxID=3122406 RepID=UPI002FEF3E4C
MTITWKNNQPLPMARPRYYDHQYLRASDLSQAVDYLLSRQHLFARLHHPVGVVSGLEITPTGSDITVAEGTAVDADGTLVVLPAARRVTLPGDGTFHVTLRHVETLTDRRDEGGVAAETRWTEEGRVEVSATAPADPGRSVPLGRVVRSQGVVTVHTDNRLVAGLRLPVGAIVPAVGNTRQSGIQFPADPAGGIGDEAFIRYFPTVGENMMLRFGINNDPDDVIAFHQGGADRLRIGQGMLHLGSLDGVPVTAGQVVAALGFWGHGVQHGQLSFRPGRGFEMVDRSADTPALTYPPAGPTYADLEVAELRAARVRGRGGLSVVSDGGVAVRAATGLTVVKETGASGDLTVQGRVNLAAGATVAGAGRLHLDGTERLYLLNTKGVYVGYGGNTDPEAGSLWVEKRGHVGGNMQVNGNLGVKVSPTSLPDWSGGGIGTFDLFVSGAVYAGPPGGPYQISLEASTGRISGTTKQFVIPHPLDDPETPDRRLLVHAALEGPENGVYYRGEGRLVDGTATVTLPDYFEALTLPEGRTVQLTPLFDDDEPVCALAASRVRDGAFRVRTADGSPAGHAFCWQVSAVRADVEPLVTEIPATAAAGRAAPPTADVDPSAETTAPEQHIGEPVDYDLHADEEEPTGDTTVGLAGYHLAPVLRVLRDEIDRRWPHRDRASDGWIGDAAHQARPSDHNPDADNRSVNALDIDADGIDPMLVVRRCIAHPSTQYVIFDRTIWSRSRGFAPARYTGSNPHEGHLHVSVSHTPALERSQRGWGIAAAPVPKLGDRVLRVGSEGSDVRELQTIANRLGGRLTVDGDFGPKTEAWVRSFQQARKLTVDGIVGLRTVAALHEALRPTPQPPRTAAGSRTLRAGMTGDDVAFVQRFIGERYCGPATGTFDDRTGAGVRWYQEMRKITVDGVVGRQTWRQMGVTVTY